MMTHSDLLRVSVRQVMRQRAWGVILSIALGITAFIALSVLGREIRYNVGQDMVLLGGVNLLLAYSDYKNFPGSPPQEFYPETIDALRKAPGVFMVSANTFDVRDFSARLPDHVVNIPVTGADEYFWEIHSGNLLSGRFLTEEDIKARSRVCVVGRKLAEELFGKKEAVGQQIFLGSEVFQVVGTFSGVMMGEWQYWAFIPYTTAQDRNFNGGRIGRLFVRAVAWEDVARLVKEIPNVVAERQKFEHLVIRTQEEQLERIRITFLWVEALLWLGIAASLMLGGFGIWSGTFAAVRARTREVGLKKAMGGADMDILSQFLVEALCKAVAGGVLGIAVGTAVVEIGAWLLPCSVSYGLLLASSAGSIVFSAAIGVVGGLYPAARAGRMDVVTALRFE